MLACALLAMPRGVAAQVDLPSPLDAVVAVASAELAAEKAPAAWDPARSVGDPREREVVRALFGSHPQPQLTSGLWPGVRMRAIAAHVATLPEHALDPASFGAPALDGALARADASLALRAHALAGGADLGALREAFVEAGAASRDGELQAALVVMRLERALATRTTKVTTAYLAARVRAAFADPDAWWGELLPHHTEYLGLLRALPRYRAVAIAGGFSSLSLLDRLRWEGWLPADGPEPTPDELAQALRGYQRAHVIEPTGDLDKDTEKALAVPARDRLRSVLLAIDRWQHSPTRNLPTYVRVNVPAFVAEVWRDGELRSVRGAIVGTLGGQTDLLDRAIHRVQLNPPWWVPPGVKRVDLDKRAELNPSFYKENGFRRFVDAEGHERVWMPPGPDNWLGRVIFRWRGGGNIYIHDTPFKERFAAVRRVFSHGCVNLEGAVDLGRELVIADGAATAEEYDRKLESMKTVWIDLKTPVPAFLEYVTAVPDEQGRVAFKPDLYGHDRRDIRRIQVELTPDTAQN